jgi:hypothetical protein
LEPLLWVTTGLEPEPDPEPAGIEAEPLVEVVTGLEYEDEDDGGEPLEDAPVVALP